MTSLTVYDISLLFWLIPVKTIVSGLAPVGLWREAMKVISVSEGAQPEGPTMRPLKGPVNQGEALPLIPHKSIFCFFHLLLC